ncbi:MAG: Rho termination factor N-terminal domain-containing protein [Micrococcales bacterium]|nr:Rho termination factor N-terminal domain-containing protein [Micrococcales bacterium]OJX69946.1 MAG: Rho termination factor [Micrococcales bacterium 72-143]
MPGSRDNALKDPKLYEELRDKGDSKEKAARISNAVAARGAKSVGRTGGKAADLDDRTVAQLRSRAKELGLRGYSSKTKSELIDLIRNH